MGLGILEDKVLEHVPGTTQYFDNQSDPQVAGAHTGLKCDTSGPEPIILIPQPSDDPNDPLNWPLWKRDSITFILSMTAIFATALGPVLAAETVPISIDLAATFDSVALLTGYFLLGCGVAAFFFVPSGRIWGKRHLFILGTIILIFSSVWAGITSRDGANVPVYLGDIDRTKMEKKPYYNSLVGARVVQGIGCAPFESLVNAAIGDMYFVHQRGKRMAFTNLAVFGGAFFTPILAGVISERIGWWWNFHFIAIFCAVCLAAIVLFCPETAYRRDNALNIDLAAALTEGGFCHSRASDDPGIPSSSADRSGETIVADRGACRHDTGQSGNKNGQEAPNSVSEQAKQNMIRGKDNPPVATAGPIIPKVSWFKSMALFNGRKTDEDFWRLLLRPLPLFVQPAFMWGCLIQGSLIGWTVFIGAIMGALFLGPPLFWGAEKTGYAYIGAFIGAIAGFFIAGGLSDWSAKKLTKLNGGVYEPEFRIVMVLPQLILGAIGLYGIGWACEGLYTKALGVTVPITFFGFEVAGMVVGAVASSLYIVDAYRHLSIEAFTCMIIFKNLFSFALTFKAFDWVTDADTVESLFYIVASVHIAICLLSIPMYVWGKRNRAFFYRHDILKKLHL